MNEMRKNGIITDNKEAVYEHIEHITERLLRMTKEERLRWFDEMRYLEPLNFAREIDGTIYIARCFFREDGHEKIIDRIDRLLVKKRSKE